MSVELDFEFLLMLTDDSAIDGGLRGNATAHNFRLGGKGGVFSEDVMLDNESIRADSAHVLKKVRNDLRGDQVVTVALLEREVGSRSELDNICCHYAHLPCAVN